MSCNIIKTTRTSIHAFLPSPGLWSPGGMALATRWGTVPFESRFRGRTTPRCSPCLCSLGRESTGEWGQRGRWRSWQREGTDLRILGGLLLCLDNGSSKKVVILDGINQICDTPKSAIEIGDFCDDELDLEVYTWVPVRCLFSGPESAVTKGHTQPTTMPALHAPLDAHHGPGKATCLNLNDLMSMDIQRSKSNHVDGGRCTFDCSTSQPSCSFWFLCGSRKFVDTTY